MAANAFESIITIEAETSGRYVRVQKSGTNPNGNTLNLVEIQIFESCNNGIEAATIHKSSCAGADNNGAIDLTALVDPTSGTAYNYYLYDGNDTSTPSANVTGATSGIFTGLDAGTYTVVAQEQNGSCSTSQRVLTILEKEDKPFIITDGALNVLPNLKTKMHILKNAVKFCNRIGINRPKVSVLSATEEVLESVQSSLDAKEITEMALKENLNADIYRTH
mgnify:CR=1 FL=1